jgi:hypothetical protein
MSEECSDEFMWKTRGEENLLCHYLGEFLCSKSISDLWKKEKRSRGNCISSKKWQVVKQNKIRVYAALKEKYSPFQITFLFCYLTYLRSNLFPARVANCTTFEKQVTSKRISNLTIRSYLITICWSKNRNTSSNNKYISWQEMLRCCSIRDDPNVPIDHFWRAGNHRPYNIAVALYYRRTCFFATATILFFYAKKRNLFVEIFSHIF